MKQRKQNSMSGGASNRHIPKVLEMGIPEIGYCIRTKANKTPSYGQGRHITD